MIVRPKENWFRLLFVWHGSVLQSIMPQLIFMGAVSTLAVVTHGRIFGEKIPLNPAPFTLFGLALAIFLAFRNNASYERFNEARHLWGNLLISARALTSQAICYIPGREHNVYLGKKLIAFVYVLKHQLRETDPTSDLLKLLNLEQVEALKKKCYKPIALLNEIRRDVSARIQESPNAEAILWMMDAQINELGNAVGGCERIASTPIPFAYSVLLHRTTYVYCLLLPFGLVDSTEFFTPLLCVFFSYTLIALEAIASEVAEPFTLEPNALALDAMSRNIERSILELCEQDIPDEIAAGLPYHLT